MGLNPTTDTIKRVLCNSHVKVLCSSVVKIFQLRIFSCELEKKRYYFLCDSSAVQWQSLSTIKAGKSYQCLLLMKYTYTHVVFNNKKNHSSFMLKLTNSKK